MQNLFLGKNDYNMPEKSDKNIYHDIFFQNYLNF